VETSTEAAPVVLPDRDTFTSFVSNVILHRHLERLPTARLRDALIATLADLAAADDPPFALDYWRLNMAAVRAPAARLW
jgi:hypothetical protein